jgi:hypothetical protein
MSNKEALEQRVNIGAAVAYLVCCVTGLTVGADGFCSFQPARYTE